MTTSRTMFRAVIVAFVVGVLGLAGAGTALAHNALIGTEPSAGQSIATSPAQVVLTFDQAVQNYQPLVTVIGPDGDHWEGSPATVLNNTVTVPVNTLGPAGAYTIAFRIISADGHPVEGTSTFTLTAAGTGTANPATGGPTTKSNAIPAWVWVVGAGLVIAVIVGGGVIGSRRRAVEE